MDWIGNEASGYVEFLEILEYLSDWRLLVKDWALWS
jgi:hypothetical protein